MTTRGSLSADAGVAWKERTVAAACAEGKPRRVLRVSRRAGRAKVQTRPRVRLLMVAAVLLGSPACARSVVVPDPDPKVARAERSFIMLTHLFLS